MISCAAHSCCVAAGAVFGSEEFALLYFKALLLFYLPFVETGTAQGDSLGAALQAGLADGLEVDEDGHFVPFGKTIRGLSLIVLQISSKESGLGD